MKKIVELLLISLEILKKRGKIFNKLKNKKDET